MGEVAPIAYRAFVAACPAEEQIERLDAALAPWREVQEVRWVPRRQFHFTLRFVEALPAPYDVFAGELAAAARRHPPFGLHIGGKGVFPTGGRRPATPRQTRTLWVGCDEGRDELCGLAASVEAAARNSGLPAEPRAFHPHLTVGRVRRDRKLRTAWEGALDLGSCRIESLRLFRSTLDPRGARHDLLQEFPLGGPADHA